MNILTDQEQMIGKTVKSILSGYETEYIVFTDDSVIVFKANNDDYDGTPEINLETEIDDYTLKELGFITEEELEKRAKEAQLERQKKQKENLRQQYEELKRIFEP